MAATKNEKVIGLAELMMHATEKDCWVVYRGGVYDVAKFADEHPGGAELITALAGQDMTTPFDDVEHSDEAKEELATFRVGKLEDGAVPMNSSTPKAIRATGSSTLGPVIVIASVIGAAYFLKNYM